MMILKSYILLQFQTTLLVLVSADVGCYIPKKDYLIVKDEFNNITLNPETYVEPGTFIKYYCARDSFLDGIQLTNYCEEDNWVNSHPKCIKMCPPITGRTIKVICNFQGKGISCNEYVEPGTTAKISCAVMYEPPKNTLVHEDLICQLDGNWDYSPFACEQVCGTIETKTAFSVQSKITEIHKVPWHAAIYQKNETNKYEHICGGTIIYSNVIISAAHCFWNTITSSLNNESDYLVAVGKFYRDFYAKNETETVQIRSIHKINSAIQFSGPDYDYLGDVAVLLLDDHIEYKNHIRPACLTWKNYNDRFIPSNIPGIVAGWGVTDTGTFSSKLRSVVLLSLDGASCKNRLPSFSKISNDKFCVETSQGKNVCSGDSGGGFLVSVPVNGTVYYHLWGIVSNGIINQQEDINACNSKFTTNFINIQYYQDLVTQSIKNFSLVARENSGCYVPVKRYLILIDSQSDTILEPGNYVKSLTSIKYACKENASLAGGSHTNLCDGEWMQPHPKCIKMCPPIKAYNMNVLCSKRRNGVSCNKPVLPRTKAKISCAFMYKNSEFQILYDELYCEKDGSWSYTKFKCDQICGTIDSTTPFNSRIRKTEVYSVPWQASIYYMENLKYKYVCGGTLIGSRMIITAASCFSVNYTMEKVKSKYIITVGNLYHDLYDKNETEIIQTFNIFEIGFYDNFTITSKMFANDIAIVILDGEVIYKNHIRPVCLYWKNSKDKKILSNMHGKVIGSYNQTLISTALSTIDNKLCKQVLKRSYRITKKKFCAQQITKKNIYSVSRGSGFVVPEYIDGSIRYHLWGVASMIKSIKNNSSENIKPITIFTNVQMYESLIRKYAGIAETLSNFKNDFGCHIPRIRHLIFLENSTNSVLVPGTYVPLSTSISYRCQSGVLDGDYLTNFCFEDWSYSHPECTELCLPIVPDHTIKLNCNYKGKKVPCDQLNKPGTIAKISCAFMYKKPSNINIHEKIQCQSDGDWDHDLFKCEEICGTVDKELLNEENILANVYRAPWLIAFYLYYFDTIRFVCSGTLVKSKVVISVAHCFPEYAEKKLINYSNYKVIAGKLYQDYYTRRDRGLIQESKILDVKIPVQYIGEKYDYISDIAVVLLEDHIVYKNHIRPACLIWKNYQEKFLPNKEGEIAGWVETNSPEYDKEIRSIQFISVRECKNYTSVFKVTGDKFCTQLMKKDNICSSGTGLLIPEDINGTTYYNLWGIISLDLTSSHNGRCLSNTIIGLTNIQYYEKFIEAIINEFYNYNNNTRL